MPAQTSDFRLLVQQEFVNRCRKNKNYSLRAYARSLGIAASPLSAMLRGKRPITAKMRQKLGAALGLSLEEIGRLSAATVSNNEYQQLTIDSYAVISDWYHYAILELLRVKSFKPSMAYIAKTLGISATEAQIAVERLQRVALLEIGANGKWKDTSINGLATNINGDLTSQASKQLQKQILEKGMESVDTLPLSVRNNTSLTVAIHPDDLPAAKERIKKFRRELCTFFEKNKNPTKVYHLGICLYPVSHLEDR